MFVELRHVGFAKRSLHFALMNREAVGAVNPRAQSKKCFRLFLLSELISTIGRLRFGWKILIAAWAGQQFVRYIVASEFFLGRIPLQVATKHQSNVAKMAGGHRAMVRIDVRDRVLAVVDAIEEVFHMTTIRLA